MVDRFETNSEKQQKMTGKRMFPAIAELEIAHETMTTNAPINEKEGNLKQARLERRHAKSFRAAIDVLKEQ